MLRFFNTLTDREEDFHPLTPGRVGIYACGPTVYDYAHIGNFRTFVFMDVLRRFLKWSGLRLTHVMNITDVDDRIIQNAAAGRLTVRQYTEKFEQAFLEDMATLSLEPPEITVRATEHIDDMAAFIRDLERKGFAYRTEDGSYYFRIAKFPEYGKLSKKDFAGIEDGARVDVDRYEKDNARDFALWKAPKEGEASWQTSLGPGRPGWHIECSVMAMKYLGESFDIHLGGEDLIFPHHENEIAQSEARTGKPFARYWLHARFLLVEGEKMSKSLGNYYTLRDLVLMGHKPSSLRYLLASVPYHKQLNFTFDGLKQAAHSVERLRTFKLRLETEKFPPAEKAALSAATQRAVLEMRAGLEDDLNTAQALAAIFDLVREANTAADNSRLTQQDVAPLLGVLQGFDEIFAVLKDDDAEKIGSVREWAQSEGKLKDATAAEGSLSDDKVEALIGEREQARRARDFARSDAIRKQLADAGIVIEDRKDGARWKRK
ncbi:MAG: cysteine--tRNA ligase [Acidobacteria bacterium]|nr:cysteine--tRNA ligase [Acidobacteriota bacterium]